MADILVQMTISLILNILKRPIERMEQHSRIRAKVSSDLQPLYQE